MNPTAPDNTPTPRTDAKCLDYSGPLSFVGDEQFLPADFARQIERELAAAQGERAREASDVAAMWAIRQHLHDELLEMPDVVECVKGLRAQLATARELLREIRDNEVNASDEADKFLRDHQPSELSALRYRLATANAPGAPDERRARITPDVAHIPRKRACKASDMAQEKQDALGAPPPDWRNIAEELADAMENCMPYLPVCTGVEGSAENALARFRAGKDGK